MENSQMASLNSLPPTFVKTFIRQLNILKLVGIDIFNEPKKYALNLFKILIILIFSLYMLAGMVLYVVRKDEIGAEFLEVVRSITVIVGYTQALVKLSVLFLNRKEIREVIEKIGQIWPINIENEEKLQRMRFWAQRLNFFGGAFFKAAVVTLALFEFVPLAMTVYEFNTKTVANYKFTIQIYFFHYIDSHYLYVIAYIYQVITSTRCILYVACYVNLGLSCCAVSLTLCLDTRAKKYKYKIWNFGKEPTTYPGYSHRHKVLQLIKKSTLLYICIYISSEILQVALILDVSALFNLLKIDLENVIPPSDSLTDFEEDENCDDIKDIVILHQKLLSIVDDLNRIFGKIIFTQVSSSSVVICCYGFMALMADGMFLNYIAAALVVMFEIFILSYPGQMLVDTSLDIADAAYDCQWYRRSTKFRKYIAIIMTRSQKPCHLSALGFYDLNFNMFSKVMSTSWSYLSLLNQMYGDL